MRLKAFQYSGIMISVGYWMLMNLWKTMPIQVEWGFCLLLLAITGIPHGAADHLVAEKLAFRANKSFSLSIFIIKYLSVMLMYGIVWYFFPLLSFILFILISVFHFGDLETTFTTKSNLSGIRYLLEIIRSLILGAGILGFILSQHAVEVSNILQHFNLGVTIPVDTFSGGFYLFCILLGFQKEHQTYFIHTAVTLLIGTYLPILPAFMCYFAGCHAIYSLRVLSTSLAIPLASIYRSLLPFTGLAFLMGALYVCIVSQDKWIAHAFMFLSILTLPHFFLMHQISVKKREK